MKSINLIQEYLEVYKELEGALRNHQNEIRVLDYEKTLPPNEEEKLRICRQVRNYIQHHDNSENFIAISPGMIEFLETVIENVTGEKRIVKDKLYRLTPITDANKLSEILNRFVKSDREWLPATDKNGMYIGCINRKEMLRLLSCHTPGTILKKCEPVFKKDVRLLKKEDPIADLAEQKPDCVVVEAKEKSKIKYVGVVKW